MNSIGVNELMNDLFVSESRENISENEISFVYEALYIINPQLRPINLKLISINENYDIFKFDSGDESYCLKLSLDGKCKAINHEIKFLKNINKIISPHFYSGGTIKIGENIKYILSSYENADSISEIGKSFLLENFHNFCETYSLMQNSKKINFTYKDYLKTKFYKKKINGYFLNFNLKKINKSIDLLKIEQIIKELESNIDSIYTEDMDSDKNICHGLLNPANIISRNGLFKFINFDNCFTGPFYLDFMEFILEMNFSTDIEKAMLKICKQKLNLENNDTDFILYKKCSRIVVNKKLIEIIVSYLIEVYIYQSKRKNKILKICSLFSMNYERWRTNPIFIKNKDFITKLITEPLQKNETI